MITHRPQPDSPGTHPLQRRSGESPAAVRWLLVGLSLAFLGLFLFAPLAVVLAGALGRGVTTYLAVLRDPLALAAIRLTLLIAAIVVPLNTAFGVAAAWAITKFSFPGRQLLITLIELPLAVSPVISGLIFVLLFGARGPWVRGWRRTASASSSPSPASSWPRPSSPFPMSPGS